MGDKIMKTAYLFPGQGSQKVGMGKDHYQSNETFAQYIDKANSILGFDLKKIMFEGPAEKLKQTQYTQPAIFAHSVALYQTLNARTDMAAGHSLGEFSALAAVNAISFREGLQAVHQRGSLMQEAGEQNEGTMAAIIGMEDEQVEELCQKASKEIGKTVIPANYNCPGQLVIAGYVKAVEKAIELAKKEGCRLARMLPVSGAFHSPLMKPAFEGLRNVLSNMDIQQPDCPIFSNFTAEPVQSVDKIKSNLLNQLLNPVLWRQSLVKMQRNGAEKFVEVGMGKVLQGLVKRTLNNVEITGYQ
jgi:[acyl-carrier-protein] S-malonyltransferase